MDSTNKTFGLGTFARIARSLNKQSVRKTAQNVDFPLELFVKIDGHKGEKPVSEWTVLSIDGQGSNWTLEYNHPGYPGGSPIHMRTSISQNGMSQFASVGELSVVGENGGYQDRFRLHLTPQDQAKLQVWMDDRLGNQL